MIIDTHAHIYLPEFENDRGELLERAENEGVKKIFLPAIDTTTHETMLLLEQQKQGVCYAMMGVHPCSVKGNYKLELREARNHLESRRFIAVGEIGLDFYWDKSHNKEQYAAFHEQVEWAINAGIPVVIHSRQAIDECIALLSEHQDGRLKGVFHCFSGDKDQAERIIELGFYLGIGGVVTFKNGGLDKALENIALESMVLETDSPYLAPVPFRGKRNEPSYLKYVTARLSELKSKSTDEVAEITTGNALKLFVLNQTL